MLPPLFPSDVSESVKQKVVAIESSVRGSINHTVAALHSSVWMIGVVAALVFGSLGTLTIVVLAMGPSGSETGQAQYNGSGAVRGAWTDYYYANANISSDQPGVFDSGLLQWQLENYVAEHADTEFGIVVVPVSAEGVVEVQSDRVFVGASTTKVLTATTVLAKVDRGELTLESVAYEVVPDVKKENENKDVSKSSDEEASPSATPTPEPKKVSINEALRLMINRSDNRAWEHLIALIGSRNLQAYAEEIGMQDYNVRNNEVSSRDLAVLLQKLHRNELLTESSTQYLLALMQQTNEEQMIPAAMQSVGAVYHKYGWLGKNVHDVAIVENSGNPVVVVVLTEGNAGYGDGKAMVRDVAEIVEQALIAGGD